ncbi:UDP-Glycosyltransferase/glycogen phosphorylase [Meira miltonrushii]|uniref:Sterol 3-beta-glucosyltransferase n=1 Tax=Meira miltonrushii TaxID=1280837 RepID=A0A316V691_9BASI|nr:UDP-Glycosyltransferase/glycogen phosphorylase [Meira miltonrushii]PWN32538.1 UDP-Glycosyltransferase/glycogen phosphorylase [Meira miltonrushii]
MTCSQLLCLHALSSVADLSNDPVDASILKDHLEQDQSHPQTTPIQAKDELIRRLHHIFDLDEKEELISSHPCWLFRNIVLQGYLYVLTNNLCFYANLPSRQDKLIRSGILRKKTRKTRRFSSHWAILRGRTLSWYESEYDPYFPQDKIDLRDVLEVNALSTASNPQFEVVTPYRTFLFETSDADEWVAALKKSTFRAQNEGENVRITIPYEAMLDIDSSNANPVADVAVVTIKVIQSQPGETEMTMDEYFFTNMADEAQFVALLRDKLASINAVSSQASTGSQIRASFGPAKTIASGLRRTETLRQGNRTPTLSVHRAGTDTALESQLADATNDTSISTPPSASTILSTSVTTLKAAPLESSATGYPPSPHIDPASIDSLLGGGDKKWSIPQWLLEASGRLAQNTSGGLHAITNRLPTRLVREQWSAQPLHDTAAADVQKEEDMKEQESLEQFRSCFSLPDDEELLHHTSTNLYRILPVSGRLFVSTNYVCFRSSRLATKTIGRTMMILPRKEIISVAKNNAVQYGRHGLVIIVRGHEELFFEFVSTHRRDQCISIIELQPIGHMQDPHNDDEEGVPSLSLTDLGFDVQSGSDSSQNLSVSSLFASSSSFVPIKPKENMHFTFLTVGSRGDVQPYIALGRGLQREGHRVRIATHAEFGKWIESFGIEFCEIGGDPAELMRICIENGTFTLAFVRESVTKFRGWLDDLLLSCWHACQGTDVIIESPSAIAGIHIAEALRIPYYRAFTMPWTRTRSYPHAFAVPSRRAGGNYNYMSYVIFDQVFWRASAGQINAWRKKCLRLSPTNMDKLEQHKIPFLYNFSPSLVPKPLDWSDWIHVCGFWFLDNADETGSSQVWQAPKELIEFIAKAKQNQKKIVYIGWGSIVIADADAVLQTVIEAVRKSDVCAIISKGWSDRLQEGKDSTSQIEEAGDDVWQNIFTIQSVPHDWLFPQMDAACHHGGSGTLGASLRAGIPTIVRPFFGDQFFWASQVESLQIGVSVANKPFTVDTFANALRICTTDARMKRNARTLADSIAKEKGVSNAIRAIYADWDYACSRVKPNPTTITPLETTLLPSGEEDEEAQSMDEWSVVSGSEEGIADVI